MLGPSGPSAQVHTSAYIQTHNQIHKHKHTNTILLGPSIRPICKGCKRYTQRTYVHTQTKTVLGPSGSSAKGAQDTHTYVHTQTQLCPSSHICTHVCTQPNTQTKTLNRICEYTHKNTIEYRINTQLMAKILGSGGLKVKNQSSTEAW